MGNWILDIMGGVEAPTDYENQCSCAVSDDGSVAVLDVNEREGSSSFCARWIRIGIRGCVGYERTGYGIEDRSS